MTASGPVTLHPVSQRGELRPEVNLNSNFCTQCNDRGKEKIEPRCQYLHQTLRCGMQFCQKRLRACSLGSCSLGSK